MAGAEIFSYNRRKRFFLLLLGSLLIAGLGLTNVSAEPLSPCASLRSMARIYMASGGYAKAQPFLEKALHMARQTNAPETEESACLLDLAYLYNNQGKLTAAETMCLSGLALQQKAYDPNHPYVAHTLRILSEIYRRQGRYEQAANALDRAITIIRDVGRADDLELAPFKVDMARLLAAQGELARAESYYQEAIDIIESRYGFEHFYTAKVLASMAELYVLQERYVEADALMTRALPIQEKIFGPDHELLVPAWLTASRIHMAHGDPANARRLLDKSLKAVENRSGLKDEPPHPSLADVLEALVQFHLQTGNPAEAAKLTRRLDQIRLQQHVAYAPVATAME